MACLNIFQKVSEIPPSITLVCFMLHIYIYHIRSLNHVELLRTSSPHVILWWINLLLVFLHVVFLLYEFMKQLFSSGKLLLMNNNTITVMGLVITWVLSMSWDRSNVSAVGLHDVSFAFLVGGACPHIMFSHMISLHFAEKWSYICIWIHFQSFILSNMSNPLSLSLSLSENNSWNMWH